MRGLLLSGLTVAVLGLWSGCSSSSTNVASGGSGGSDGGGASGSGGAVGGASGSGGDASVDVPAPACDPNAKPDGQAVFVSPDGDDTTGSGSMDKPLKTLGQALKLAANSGPKLVVADQGNYKESVTFDSKVAGVAVRGGFKKTGSLWARDCDAAARQKTVIDSPTNVGVRVENVAAKLETLSVQTKAKGATASGAAGESQYGVFVTGDDASVSLTDVRVVAGAGGDGGDAVKLVASTPVTCDGLAGCGNGGSGTPGTAGTDAPASTFDLAGHLPGNGADGKPSSSGSNGMAGKDDGTTKTGCHSPGCAGVCSSGTCGALGTAFSVKGEKGKCGCGGLGGTSGGGGWGGGASVALFVSGKGVVTVAFSELASQVGGKGSAGKAGAIGLEGTDGSKGANVTCHTNCYSASPCGNCEQNSEIAIGGAKGGLGGKGGDGKPGGNGAGGPSVAIVRVGGAVVTLSDGSLPNPGKGGFGAGSAPAGKSASELILSADGGAL